MHFLDAYFYMTTQKNSGGWRTPTRDRTGAGSNSGGQEASMYLPLHCRREVEEAVDILRLLPYYSSVTEPTKKFKRTVTGHAWGRLSRPVDVCVGRFPAVCAKPVRQHSHADLSIAMTKHRADQAHGGTEY